MQHITDSQIDELVNFDDAEAALRLAYADFGTGQAAMQERIRTEAGGIKLSTLGAVIPGQGVAGAKVYTTIAGQFTFVILLFSTDTGKPLATFDAASITRVRTAACSVLAARHLCVARPSTMALLGAGVQGQYHAIQMARVFGLDEIRVYDPYAPSDLADRLASETGARVTLCDAAQAVEGARLVVTASRSTTPLFSGDRLAAGSFIAAIGSSLPHTRELDDATLHRASTIAVEWKTQTLREAGDLVMGDPAALAGDKLVELSDLVNGLHPGRRNDDEITLYKTVGVGLEDIAIAGLAYQRLTQGA